jgi:DNA-binding beta-propeller fold protein YncE
MLIANRSINIVIVATFFLSLLLTGCVLAPVNGANSAPLERIGSIDIGTTIQCMSVNEITDQIYVGVNDGLIIVDGQTNTVETKILVGKNIIAIGVNTQTNRLYAGEYIDKVYVLDATTFEPIDQIPEQINSHASISVDSQRNLIYLGVRTNITSGWDRLVVYDGSTNIKLDFLDIPESHSHPFIETVGVAVNPITNRIYLTWSGNDNLYMIDGETFEILKTAEAFLYFPPVINPLTNNVYFCGQGVNGDTLEEIPFFYNVAGDTAAVDVVNNVVYNFVVYEDRLTALNGTNHELLSNITTTLHSTDLLSINQNTGKLYLTVGTYRTSISILNTYKPDAPVQLAKNSLPIEYILVSVSVVAIVLCLIILLTIRHKKQLIPPPTSN